ncbi:MAG: DUF3267 domain-containing protein [Blastochloris sp.]|nr:DUF3267 domain-containing protein [Blastochloris sp.]
MQTTLPYGYAERGRLDLASNRVALFGLLGAALALVPATGWTLWQVTAWLRPAALSAWADLPLIAFPAGGGFIFNLPITWLAGALIALLITIPLHEAIHGLCFWLFTRRRPRFGLSLFYAYAAPPADVYLLRNPYLCVTLAPLVLITGVVIVLIPVAPVALLPGLLGIALLNTTGAVGDLLVAIWLLRYPASLRIGDAGDCITIYAPIAMNEPPGTNDPRVNAKRRAG